MSTAPDVSVIVVSWNTRDLLEACLRSVQRDDETTTREVIVVDNGSSDGSADLVRETFPETRLIANAENRGFATANNQGIAVAAGRYCFLLNSDAEIEPGALRALVVYADAHPEVGIAGPQLRFPDGRLQPSGGRTPTPGWTVLTQLGIARLLGRARYGTRRDYTRPAQVDEVSGAAMLIRRAVIDKIGGLDDGFTWGYEDVDYCLRARRAGWRVHYVPSAQVLHHWGGSRRVAPAPTVLRAIAGEQRYFRMHFGPRRAGLVLAGTTASHAMKLAAFGAMGLVRPPARGRARVEWQVLQGIRRAARSDGEAQPAGAAPDARPLRVLMVSGSLPAVVCGIGDYTAVLASALARQPNTTIQILTTRTPVLEPDLVAPAIILPTISSWGIEAVRALLHLVGWRRPDIVHIQYPAVGYGRALGIVAAPLALRLRGVPVVLTLHERREWSRPARLAMDSMALAARAVVMMDPVEARDLTAHVPGLNGRVRTTSMISTIPRAEGIDRVQVRGELGAEPSDLVIASFGLIHPRRRLEAIVDALSILRTRGIRARLWIMGGEAEYDATESRRYATEIRNRIATVGVQDAVAWLGHVPPARLSALLQASDVSVLLYPTGASGRNTTLRAALEHGHPVVTTGGAATPTALRNTAGIVFIDPRAQAGQVADAILAASKAAGASGRAGSAVPEHVAFHEQLYRSLIRK